MICIICINALLYKSGKLQGFASWHFVFSLRVSCLQTYGPLFTTPTYNVASHSQNNAGINKCLANLRQKRSLQNEYCTGLMALSYSSGSGSDLSHRVCRSESRIQKRDSILGMRFTQLTIQASHLCRLVILLCLFSFIFPTRSGKYTRERCRELQNTQTGAGLSSC